MTFSIIAHDVASGQVGIAAASKTLATGARVPHIRTGVGAIASQARVNRYYGPRGLALLAAGASAGRRSTGPAPTEASPMRLVAFACAASTGAEASGGTAGAAGYKYDCRSKCTPSKAARSTNTPSPTLLAISLRRKGRSSAQPVYLPYQAIAQYIRRLGPAVRCAWQ
jgi:hypothetical protein